MPHMPSKTFFWAWAAFEGLILGEQDLAQQLVRFEYYGAKKLNIECEGKGTSKNRVTVSIPEGAFGMEYTLERGTLKDAYENRMNPVNDDGTLKGVPFLTDYYSSVHQTQALDVASELDTFLGYLSAERSSVNWTFSGADLLRKIDKALEEYGFLFALANKRYDEASDAHSYGEAQF
ncbi:hypothetical protein J3E74DRAFT_293277 [Bipolaris maydis]|nr:hypothetical protein J3E74DRAFT_293277 [Bipolaris maydis]